MILSSVFVPHRVESVEDAPVELQRHPGRDPEGGAAVHQHRLALRVRLSALSVRQAHARKGEIGKRRDACEKKVKGSKKLGVGSIEAHTHFMNE